MYDRKCLNHLGKLKIHWLGLYIVIHITHIGAVKLQKLDGTLVKGFMNGIHLNPYQDSYDLVDRKKREGEKRKKKNERKEK